MAQPTLEGLTLNPGADGSDLAVETVSSKLWQAVLVGYSTGAGAANVVMVDTGLPVVAETGATWACTQSGTWNITNISGTVSLPTGAATEATLSTLDGKVTACDTGAVVLATGSAVIGKLAANSGVDIGDVDVTSLPADTFVAEAGALGKGVLLQGDDGTDRCNVLVDTDGHFQIDVLSCASHAVTNAGTFAVQVDGAALTALQLIDNSIATIAAPVPASGTAVAGTDGTNARLLKTDASGELQIDVLSCASHAVTNAGTFAVQIDGAALTALQLLDNCISGNEAQVDVVTMPATAAEAGDLPSVFTVVAGDDGTDTHPLQVDSNGALKVVTQTSLSPIEVVGDVAEDVAVGATNPVLTGGRYDSSERSLDNGDVGAAAISAQGWAMVANQSSYVFDGATRCQVKRATGLAASGTTAMVAAVADKKIRVLSLVLISTSATVTNVYIANDDNDIIGDSSNPLPLSMDADGNNVAGLTLQWNIGGWFETDTVNEALNLILSAAQDVIYLLSYIEVD